MIHRKGLKLYVAKIGQSHYVLRSTDIDDWKVDYCYKNGGTGIMLNLFDYLDKSTKKCWFNRIQDVKGYKEVTL